VEATTPVRKQLVDVRVTAREGAPLETEWRVGKALVVVKSDVALGAATNRSVTVEYLREQLGRLGNTPYQLANVELQMEGQPFAPASLLNRARREAVERLQQAQGSVGQVVNLRTECHSVQPGAARPIDAVPQTLTPHATPALHLLVRTPEQLKAALAVRPASITLDYLDLYGLKPSLEHVRAAGIAARVASPRVLKPGEERIVDFLLSCECPLLVRSAGLLHQLREKPHAELVGDFSLNAANTITAAEFLSMGLRSLTPAHDLNAAQVAELARGVGGDRVEAILYQHLPVFHTEHCVFCRFLSTGTSYRDCGRPCESHTVELRDPAGRAHPVMADVGCRNTVFGAEAQEASRHLDEWRAAGIAHFRLEFAHESGEQVTGISGAFADCLTGRIGARELGQELRRLTPHGTTEGSLFVPAGYQELPILQ
jgi:putative protease